MRYSATPGLTALLATKLGLKESLNLPVPTIPPVNLRSDLTRVILIVAFSSETIFSSHAVVVYLAFRAAHLASSMRNKNNS